MEGCTANTAYFYDFVLTMDTPHPPKCIALIIDGNRRYARAEGISIADGHAKGYAKVKEVALWCREVGVTHLVVYGFSTENWKRSEDEVAHIVDILTNMIFSDADELRRHGGAVRCIGDLERFGSAFLKKVEHLHNTNPPTPAFTVAVALSYGGRQEILHAVNALLAEGGTAPVTEEVFRKHLWAGDMPDPDIVIRTGGEKRLSNFLPWHSTYSELFFVDTFWPAFSKGEFLKVLEEYEERERRFGR